MNKIEQIKNRYATPIEVGNMVDIDIKYTEMVSSGKGKNHKTVETPKRKRGSGTVTTIIDHPKYGKLYSISGENISIPSGLVMDDIEATPLVLKNYHYAGWYKQDWVKLNTDDCGVNPFKPSPAITFLNQDIGSLLMRAGYGRKSDNYDKPEYNVCNSKNESDKKYLGCTYGGVNFDPYVIDADGNKKHYQRGLVWTLEQKQLLIESMYNGIEIGKFLFRHLSWNTLEKQMIETGHGFNHDCVDGKQRFNAILEFVQDKLRDSHGNLYSDLSERAQRNFMNYNKLAIGEMNEHTTDADVIAGFLHLNFTGTPMSKEHIEHVQKIKI